MSAFDKIIGYESVKKELYRIIDMIKNPEKYKAFGAKLPKGLLIHGAPGVGKTMIVNALIEEAGVPYVVLRHEMSGDSFREHIKQSFESVSKNDGCSIVLLDDLDKFSMDEDDGEEFAIVQACIDSVKDKNVFVIATVNEMRRFPKSLIRSGRFDLNIKIECPVGEEALEIITHYMENVKVAKSINYEDIAKMLTGNSCATLESVINAAAIEAAFKGNEYIEMENFVNATLTDVYGLVNRCAEMTLEQKEAIAYHEAGHAVISEILLPSSVGMVSLFHNSYSGLGGFMLPCKQQIRKAHLVLVSLGGKAACEMKFGRVASGTGLDLRDAAYSLMESVANTAIAGLSLYELPDQASDGYLHAREQIVAAEMQRYAFKAQEIIASNREFLDKVANELLEKQTLLYSDIKRIRESCVITPAVVG